MTILNATLTNPGYKNVTDDTDVRTLGSAGREYQLEVLSQFDGSAYNMLTQPSGSGKSFEQAALAVKDIIASHFTRKQIILVPQNHIAAGFFPSKGESLVFKIAGEDKTYSAAVRREYNFCETPSVELLILWLLAEPTGLAAQNTETNETGGQIAMTTYHAFARAFGRMSSEERAKAVCNLHVRADESHHIAMGEKEFENDQNQVGAILTNLMEHKHNCGITLSTATNFRGDDKCILRPEILDTFTKYRLPFLEHFKSIEVETFDVAVVESKTNPAETIADRVCAEQDEKHFVVVPPRNAGWRALVANDPSHGVNALIAAIKKGWPECRVLNLVPHEEQKSRKKSLLSEPKVNEPTQPSQYDVVVTCMLGREGTDWVPASRLHVSYVEGSITLAVQTLGRILRRFEGKTRITAQYYFPRFPEPEEGTTKQPRTHWPKFG